MDLHDRLAVIRSIAEEIITEQELKELLETKTHPVAYDGFEPSGLAHLPFGVFRPLIINELQKTGIRFKLLLADWHGWVNNKMGGDLERIRKVGEYFLEVWKAGGLDFTQVEAVWASDLVADADYWKTVLQIGKLTTVHRANRALTIMGRKEGELQEVAQYFYPMMQAADIFRLEVDICQLGLDQRRANILAREVAEKLKRTRPVVVSHHMLESLEGIRQPEGFEEDIAKDIAISSKMSKSKPASAILVHDTADEIRKKLQRAYCAPKQAENNPPLDYAKHILFRAFTEIKIERDKKFGGDVTYANYDELEAEFREGLLHPQDLKSAVALHLDKLIAPIRAHFEKNKKAAELYQFVKSQEITR